jgi:mediator of RNA polymerase II transcription subunit 12
MSGKTSTGLSSLESAAGFSAWRWTRIVLEMRLEFKRLAMRIQVGDDPLEARQTLGRLVKASFDREASADDTDLLCEAFRGIEPVVTQEVRRGS